jgi:aspartate aminotransferase
MREPSAAITKMKRSGIREIFDLANAIPGAIHLEMGEPDFPTPRHIREAAARAADAGFTKYTPNAGIPELRDAIAKKVRSKNGINAGSDQVIVTPGAIAALHGSMLALCDPGDEILLSDPAWPNYRMLCELLGLETVFYQLLPEDGMQPMAERIEPLISADTKMIVINSPSNPTGSVIDQSHLDEVLRLAEERDLWVVSDEVYDEIVFDNGTAPSAASSDHADRVISVFSFSKTYAMTGWRVGYAVAPIDVAQFVVKTQEPTTACVNAPAQMAALKALEGPQHCVREMRDSYQERRDDVTEILDAAGLPYVHPSGAFYMWIDVSSVGGSDVDFARRLLTEREVAVTPGSAFGPKSGTFVRVSLASDASVLRKGVERIVESVVDWS